MSRRAGPTGIPISPIPGAAAAVAALVASGLPTDRFLFLGFLPRQGKARRSALREVVQLPVTLVLYEAPHRLKGLLADAVTELGERPVVVARELTKIHEELWRGTLAEAHAHFSEVGVKGEITVVIGGAAEQPPSWEETAVRQALIDLIQGGESRKSAAAEVARRSGWRKNDCYRLSLELN